MYSAYPTIHSITHTHLKDQIQATAARQRGHDTGANPSPRAAASILSLEIALLLRWRLCVSMRRIVHGLALRWVAVTLLRRIIAATATSTTTLAVVVIGSAALRRAVGAGVMGGRRV